MTGLNIRTLGHVTSQVTDHVAVKSIGVVVLYLFAYLFKTQENFISILLPIGFLVVIDTCTGVAFGIKQKAISSKEFSGLGVKIFAYSVYMLTARVIDVEAGAFSIFGKVIISDWMTMAFKAYIIGTESISIFENLGKLGFPIPDRIKKYFKDFTDDGKLVIIDTQKINSDEPKK